MDEPLMARWTRISEGLPPASEEMSDPGLTRTAIVIWQTKLQGVMFPGYAWWADYDPDNVRVSTDIWNVVYTLDELVGWYPLPPPLED